MASSDVTDAGPTSFFTTLPAGAGAPAVQRLIKPSRRRSGSQSALTADGAVAVYTSVRGAQPAVATVALGAGGARSAPQTLSDPAGAASPIGEVASGFGAVVATFYQRLPGGGRSLRLAVRPTGATAFAPAVTVQPRRDPGTYFSVALGPDGAGAILIVPNGVDGPITVRRFDSSGTLGPSIVLAAGPYALASVAMKFGASGTLVAALSTITHTPTGRDDLGLFTVTLPAGSDQPTPLRRLSPQEDSSLSFENLSLAVGTDDRIGLITGAPKPSRLRVFAGPATAPGEVASFPFAYPDGAKVAIASDGSLDVAWSGRAKPRSDAAVFASHGPPGLPFNAPHRVARATRNDTSLDAIAPMPDGRFAVVYTGPRGRKYLVRVRP